jgi:hypothetical protein
MYTTDDILGWIKHERLYQRTKNHNAKKILAEIAYAQKLLDQAKADYDPMINPYRQRAVMRSFRRIAANLVRSLEKYGVPNDQEPQTIGLPKLRERQNGDESQE